MRLFVPEVRSETPAVDVEQAYAAVHGRSNPKPRLIARSQWDSPSPKAGSSRTYRERTAGIDVSDAAEQWLREHDPEYGPARR